MKNIDYDFGDRWNMSLMTLQRIDQLLKDCQLYSINNNVLGLKNNLFELYKESIGWLSKEEKDSAKNMWNKITKHKINLDQNVLSFPDELKYDLDEFDFWIRNKLHKKKVTFDGKEVSENNKGLGRMDKKYNLVK